MTATSFSMPVTSSTGPQRRRRRRGLFDFVLLLCLGYAVYARTPIGAVAETGIRIARGQKDHPSWLQTFRGRDTETTTTAVTTQALQDLSELSRRGVPATLQAAATTHGVDVDTLAALVAVRGRCDDSVCEAAAPDRLSMYVPGAAGTVDVDTLAKGLKAANVALQGRDNHELAIEALFLGTPSLQLALEQARRSALDAPDDVEVHASFLSPSARRGPLQGALAVLLVHRLRTLAWPADAKFRITSPFGQRIHPVTGKSSFHNGTDIGTPTGTPLLAAHNATVKRQSVDSVSGNYVILDHGLGVTTTYCHLSATAVKEHERIRRRDTIGAAGATGRVTGPHLHYILRIADKAVDAETWGQAPGASGGLGAPVLPTPPPTTTPPTPTPTPTKGKVPKATKVVTPPPASTVPPPSAPLEKPVEGPVPPAVVVPPATSPQGADGADGAPAPAPG